LRTDIIKLVSEEPNQHQTGVERDRHMKRLICMAAIAAMLLFTAPAMAFVTGNELKEYADKGEKDNYYYAGVFFGFVVGVGEDTEVPYAYLKGN